MRYTISEAARREVLDRLLLLNHERHEEEVRVGLVDETGKGKKVPKKKSEKLPLEDMQEQPAISQYNLF